MFAVEGGATVAWIGAISLFLTALVGAGVALTRFRTDTKSGDAATFKTILDGMQQLLDERQVHMTEQDAEIAVLQGDVKRLRDDFVAASRSYADCERDLRDALRRLDVLERKERSS